MIRTPLVDVQGLLIPNQHSVMGDINHSLDPKSSAFNLPTHFIAVEIFACRMQIDCSR